MRIPIVGSRTVFEVMVRSGPIRWTARQPHRPLDGDWIASNPPNDTSQARILRQIHPRAGSEAKAVFHQVRSRWRDLHSRLELGRLHGRGVDFTSESVGRVMIPQEKNRIHPRGVIVRIRTNQDQRSHRCGHRIRDFVPGVAP